MADIDKLKDALEEAKKRIIQFSDANFNDSRKSIRDIASENKDLYTNIFKSLLDKDSINFTKETLAKSQSQSMRDVPIDGTINSRTPYIRIWLNDDFEIFPNDIKQGQSKPDKETILFGPRESFLSLNLTSAFGGPLGTITGDLKIFSKSPIDFLQFLFDATEGIDKDSDGNITGNSGLPIITIEFGWNLAISHNEVKQVKTPKLKFLVMDVSMTDPGTGQGSEFTLKIQDIGSGISENTASNLVILPNYPQEQLRTICQRILGVRLYTPDDFLYFGKQQDITESGKTFFITEQSQALRLNGNMLNNIIEQLLQEIRLRWYPVKNKELKAEISGSKDAETEIQKARQDLKRAKSNKNENKDTIAKLTKSIEEDSARIASSCSLIWISNVPKDWPASTGQALMDGEIEEGAFFLVPNPATSDNIEPQDMPLIYGPGGSDFPYLYGAAQNVFQQALKNSNLPSRTYGDVLSVNVNYSSLVATMKNIVDENIVYVEEGGRITPKKYSNVRSLKDREAEAISQFGERGEKILPAAIQAVRSAAARYKAEKLSTKKFRLRGSFGQRRLQVGDSKEDIISVSKRTHRNVTEIKSHSLNKLNSRVSTFLNYPITIGLTVLGDPLLVGRGIGAFELLNYYPDLGENFGKLRLNSMLSGYYMPTNITHTLTPGEFISTIQGQKIPDAMNSISVGFKKEISDILSTIPTQDEIAASVNQAEKDALIQKRTNTLTQLNDQLLSVDLSNSEASNIFTSDFTVDTKTGNIITQSNVNTSNNAVPKLIRQLASLTNNNK